MEGGAARDDLARNRNTYVKKFMRLEMREKRRYEAKKFCGLIRLKDRVKRLVRGGNHREMLIYCVENFVRGRKKEGKIKISWYSFRENLRVK